MSTTSLPPPLSEAFRESALAEREKLLSRYEECRARHEHHLAQANLAFIHENTRFENLAREYTPSGGE